MTANTVSSSNLVASEVYRAFWRWHFYAGLLILPVLMLMALTGGLYLFRGEIEGIIYRPLVSVEARAAATAPSAWVETAQAALGGRVIQVSVPAEPGRSARLIVETPSGKRTAFVDPADGRLLGSLDDQGVMQTIKRLHSLELVGPWANILVEIVAGWAIVMAATGVFLWWPRGQAGGVVTVRATPSRRIFWRDLHAVTGVFAAGVIVFLAATGMPWSAVWGDQARKITNAAGWGAPKAPASGQAWSHDQHAKAADVNAQPKPWALQGLDIQSHPMAGMAPVTVDTVVARADGLNLPRPFTVGIPKAPGKAWTASRTVEQVEDTRTLYFDAGSGALLADIGYGQFGPAAKAITWGIAVHQGEQFGPINRYVMLAGCVAVWLLGISAFVMWWKRRPSGRLAPPPAPSDKRAYLGLAAVVAPLAVLYPLVGASLVAVLALDLLWRRLWPNPSLQTHP